MAVEPRRGCGYRRVGGLYLMGGKGGISCCQMPILLHVCPTCGEGVKQGRGWQWIDPRPWFKHPCHGTEFQKVVCPGADHAQAMGDKVGLLWIGTQFYKTPGEFQLESDTLGISRRLKAIPRGFEVGKHWVFLAHPKTILVDGKWMPGVFRIFKPTHFEKIVTQSQFDAMDREEMEKENGRGITFIAVPDDDKDHQGSVWDKDLDEGATQEEINFALA